MDQKLLPAILMSILSIGALVIILGGLKLALHKSGSAETQQRKAFKRIIFVVFLWVALISLLAIKGFFSDFSKLPPRPGLAVLLPLPFILWISFSKKGSALLKSVPPHWLIGMQAFRILVEIILWRAFLQNLLPVQMTFEGNNFDVLSGILAIPVAMIIKKKWSPGIVLAYNIIGLVLLLNILVIAVLSMPTPLRHFMNEPANTLVGEFPFIYLPAILVVIAYTLHIFSLRQWWLLRNSVR